MICVYIECDGVQVYWTSSSEAICQLFTCNKKSPKDSCSEIMVRYTTYFIRQSDPIFDGASQGVTTEEPMRLSGTDFRKMYGSVWKSQNVTVNTVEDNAIEVRRADKQMRNEVRTTASRVYALTPAEFWIMITLIAVLMTALLILVAFIIYERRKERYYVSQHCSQRI